MPAQKSSGRTSSRAGTRPSGRSTKTTGDRRSSEHDGFTFVNVNFDSSSPTALQPGATILSTASQGTASEAPPVDPGERLLPHTMFTRRGAIHSVSPAETGSPGGPSLADGSAPESCESSSPDTGAYSLLPGDSPYVPSSQQNSRVHASATERASSPPHTRNRSASVRKKRDKSQVTIVSSENEEELSDAQPPSTPASETLKRSRALTTTVSKPPTPYVFALVLLMFWRFMLHILSSKRRRPAQAPRTRFVDDEAEVEEEHDVHVSADESSQEDADAYDSNDSFIDDGSIHELQDAPTLPPQSPANLAPDSSPGSASFSGALDVGFMTDSLLHSESFVRALLSKLERERMWNLEDLSDEEQRMDLIMGMRPWLSSYTHASPPPSPLTRQQRDGRPTLRTPVTPTRGKGKARVSKTEVGLNSQHRDDDRFDEDTRRAIAQSMTVGSPEVSIFTPGASSSSQAQASSVSAGLGPIPSSMSTPGVAPTSPAIPPAVPALQQTPTVVITPVSAPSTAAYTPAPDVLTASSPPSQASNVVAPAPTVNIGGNSLNPSTLTSRCPSLPPACEVADPGIQDPMLASTYHLCVPLFSRQFISWSELQGPGQVNVSAWAQQCPDMSINVMVRALLFHRAGNFVNPSRADPRITRVRELPGTTPRYNLYVDNGSPLVAVTAGFLEFSQLTTPSDSGLRQRFVRIIGHTQEWERQQAFTAMSFGFPSLHTQLARDALQISTRALSTRRGADSNAGGRSAAQGMFNRNNALASGTSRVSADLFSLPADQPVPTYDARSTPDLDFDTAMPQLTSLLPAWQEGEIPYGSAVLVGYTMTVYRSNAGKWTLGCNIQFVVVLGTPPSLDQ
ncbi:hypothetical protein MD484_g5222, partial [Candolleomyces efflorescens]